MSELIGATFSSAEYNPWYPDTTMQQERQNLAEYEKSIIDPRDEHPWWSFFDGGVQDENGAVWAVYNRWCEETQASGWKVIRCPDGQAEFHEISITKVIRQEVYPATADRDGLITFQLHIYDEAAGLKNNDVLNVLLYHTATEVKPKLRLWNQKAAMLPVVQQYRVAPEEIVEYADAFDRPVAAA